MALNTSPFAGMPAVLKAALVSWAKHSVKYKPLYNLLPKEIIDIAFTAFAEMRDAKPSTFNEWWIRNHNRFIRNKNVKQYHLSMLQEIMYQFLTDFVYNRIPIEKEDSHGVERRTRKQKL